MLWAWAGPAVVLAALACASATFLVIASAGPIEPNSKTLILLYVADSLAIVLLLAMVLRQSLTLWRAWRKGEAAARLHVRTVAFFSLVALIPALAVAVVGTVSLERALSPAFMSNLKGFVHKTAEAAQTFRETQCGELLKEAQLTASDLDQSRAIYDADRNLYHKYFETRARTLGFSVAALVHPNGQILDQVVGDPTAASAIVIALPQEDFRDARQGALQCRMIDDDRTFVGLRLLTSFPDTYLYVTRPMHPFAIEFPRQAGIFIKNYDSFESFGAEVKRNFAIIYAMLTMILLLSAIWVGLDFANRLVAPIRTLIAATDEVSAGNLAVRVEVDRDHGDLSRLGAVFNKMTTELDLQQKRLLEASRINEERRAFTEAVLAGVPASVFGADADGRITVVNRSAEALLRAGGASAPGRVEDALPEIAPALRDAVEVFPRAIQTQLTIKRGARERIYNVSVTSAGAADGDRNFVVTLDDITDLVTAQRTSAWADVARRMAHEIKNPLTPIQLSAERLKRKYGKAIQTDREIFDQCIDTIVRQVDDIKRMVDEFSTFARLPKARPERDDLCESVRQTAFLMRVGNADVDIVEDLPAEGLFAQIDRRALSQALQNIVKNAIEGIAARQGSEPGEKGVVHIALKRRDGMAQIDVIDNGKGFPATNRQRLLEPYMTTRAEGTGLGLPIVAKIVEDHGGRLELLDAPSGKGACVRILLPIEPPGEAASGGWERTKSSRVGGA
ncbi:sensor histidine kinase [Methylocystis bryophila]|uniref:sensor histidine kinase n=1 Tax=Methylocystis bryophila TaxID=655015 RepID=UPI001FDA7A94|nr:PAS domain-containing sensor histidine kinase [Methylocystis bryophila]BDV39606.1 PAS domain-containing sensor histidine kinase [Methylocystis bryophila]